MKQKIKIGDCFSFGRDLLIIDHFDEGIPCYFWDGVVEMAQAADFPLLTLHLPIGNDERRYGGKWFDLICQRVKKEEYREISRFNCQRLLYDPNGYDSSIGSKYDHQSILGSFNPAEWTKTGHADFKPHKVLHLTNGYGDHRPQLWAHIKSISIGRGNPEWGAPVDRDVFIIKLGEVFHTKNLKV